MITEKFLQKILKIIQSTEYDKETGLPVSITLDIKLPADFPEKYKEAVISVAELCKVKKSIATPPVFQVITLTNIKI